MAGPVTVNTKTAPVNSGFTSDVFAGEQYQWLMFTVTADAGTLNVVLDGAVGKGGLKDYIPADSDFAPLTTITTPGVYKQTLLPTHLRFRVVAGTNVVIRTQQRQDPLPETVNSSNPTGTGNSVAPTIVPFLQGSSVVVGNLTNYNGALYPVTTAHTFTATFDATKHGSPVAVPGANGASIVNRGPFAGLATYAARDIVSNGGQLYSAKTGFTATASFVVGDWDLLVQKGVDGVGLNPRGAWAAATVYAVNDIVTNGGNTYRVNTAHTSPGTFSTTNLDLWASVGATGPNPLLLTGITGGSINSAVVLKPDGVTAADLHTSQYDEINYSLLLWKDNSGNYWKYGATITDVVGTPLTPGYIRALQPKLTNTAANYIDLNPKSARPSNLDPTANQVYLELGKVVDTTRWSFQPTTAESATLNPIARFDGLLVANYTRNQAAPTTRWRNDRFTGFDSGTPINVVTTTAGTFAPNGGIVSFGVNGTYKRRYATEELTGTFADGQIRYDLSTSGASAEYGIFTRLTGAATTETCVLFSVDDSTSTNNVKIGVMVAGTYTNLATASMAVTHGSNFQWRAETFGSWCALKIWSDAGAEPAAWTLTAFQNTVTTAGYSGVYSSFPFVNTGNFSTVVNRNTSAALTGAT